MWFSIWFIAVYNFVGIVVVNYVSFNPFVPVSKVTEATWDNPQS